MVESPSCEKGCSHPPSTKNVEWAVMLKNMLEKAAKWVLVGLVSGCSFQSSQLSFILERLSPESSNDVQGVYWKLDGQGLSGRLIPVVDADRVFFTDLTRWMVVFERDQIVGIYNLKTGSKLAIAFVDPKSIVINADAPEDLELDFGRIRTGEAIGVNEVRVESL